MSYVAKIDYARKINNGLDIGVIFEDGVNNFRLDKNFHSGDMVVILDVIKAEINRLNTLAPAETVLKDAIEKKIVITSNTEIDKDSGFIKSGK